MFLSEEVRLQGTIIKRSGKANDKRLLGDLVELAKCLRTIDVIECMAMGAEDATHGLLLSTACSAQWWIEYECIAGVESPIWVYGIGDEYHTGLGYCIWFLGSQRLQESKNCQRYFLEESKRIINEWQQQGSLWNCISKDNKASIRWLRWLGATFIEGVNLPDGFLLFTLPKKGSE